MAADVLLRLLGPSRLILFCCILLLRRLRLLLLLDGRQRRLALPRRHLALLLILGEGAEGDELELGSPSLLERRV